jgi:hypothetical protein
MLYNFKIANIEYLKMLLIIYNYNKLIAGRLLYSSALWPDP